MNKLYLALCCLALSCSPPKAPEAHETEGGSSEPARKANCSDYEKDECSEARPLSGRSCVFFKGLCRDKIKDKRKANCSDYRKSECKNANPLSGRTCMVLNNQCADKIHVENRKANCSDYDLAECNAAKPLSGSNCMVSNNACVENLSFVPPLEDDEEEEDMPAGAAEKHAKQVKNRMADISDFKFKVGKSVFNSRTAEALFGAHVEKSDDEKLLELWQGILSIVGADIAPIFWLYLDEKDIDNFIAELRKAVESINFKFADAQEEKKFWYSIAKTQALLKGFDLPAVGTGPGNELSFFDLDETERKQADEAVQAAIIKVADKKYIIQLGVTYAESILNEAEEILKNGYLKSRGNLTQNFHNYISQAIKKKKALKAEYTPTEVLALQMAAKKSYQEFLPLFNLKTEADFNKVINDSIRNRLLKLFEIKDAAEEAWLQNELDRIKDLWQFDNDIYYNINKIIFINNPENVKDKPNIKEAFKKLEDNLVYISTIAEDIVKKAVGSLKAKKYTFTPDIEKELLDKLKPAVNSLNRYYLQNNTDKIVTRLAEDLRKNASFTLWAFKIKPANLKAVADLVKKYK